MAVQVDVCGPGMPCVAAGCTAPARFWVQRDEQLKLHYCGPDALKRIATHQRQNRQIIVSDEAKKLLTEVAL